MLSLRAWRSCRPRFSFKILKDKRVALMQPYSQQFSLDFNFPVFFTRSVFSKDNTTFVTATRRLETDRRQRVLFIVDSNLVTVHTGLTDRIREYVEAFP